MATLNVTTNGQVCEEALRQMMTEFWREHSKEPSETKMMLDTNAAVLGQQEIPEILSLLPEVADHDVLELGAGIGRFTGHLAKNARSVTAVDFMDSFLQKNKELNGFHGNITFIQADVTKLCRTTESYDLVFSNWLLMYLDDIEVRNLFRSLLTWLRPGGYFFFRESCFHQSGDRSRNANPTKYRDPALYNALLQSVTVPSHDDVGVFAFEIIMSKSVQTYIKMKSNRNQICWLLHKVRRSDYFGYHTFQEFLDKQQYSMTSIRAYELVFGRNFISPGGLETAQAFCKLLNLLPGQQVLDVGSGTGGNAFHMAMTYNVHVTGIDLSANMVCTALERAHEMKVERVQFQLGDMTKCMFPSQSYDVIHSRDSILHIRDKATLFASFHKWLKPGGRLLISDYCCSAEVTWSDEFRHYVTSRGYFLLPIAQYAALLKSAGFVNVRVEDKTSQFIDILQSELRRLDDVKDQFTASLSSTEYDAMVSGWNNKLRQCAAGHHKWALFCAEKPTERLPAATA